MNVNLPEITVRRTSHHSTHDSQQSMGFIQNKTRLNQKFFQIQRNMIVYRYNKSYRSSFRMY